MFETLKGLSHTRDHLKQLRSVYTASDGVHQVRDANRHTLATSKHTHFLLQLPFSGLKEHVYPLISSVITVTHTSAAIHHHSLNNTSVFLEQKWTDAEYLVEIVHYSQVFSLDFTYLFFILLLWQQHRHRCNGWPLTFVAFVPLPVCVTQHRGGAHCESLFITYLCLRAYVTKKGLSVCIWELCPHEKALTFS